MEESNWKNEENGLNCSGKCIKKPLVLCSIDQFYTIFRRYRNTNAPLLQTINQGFLCSH